MFVLSTLLAVTVIGQGASNPPRLAQPRFQVPQGVLALRGRPLKRINAPYRAIKAHAVSSTKPILNISTKPDIDLRPSIQALNLSPRDQGSRGTCSVHALTFLIEYMGRAHRSMSQRDLSEEFLNHMTNVALGQYGDGDFFSNLAMGYRNSGMAPESLLPYQPTYNASQVVSPSVLKAAQTFYRFSPCFIKEWNVNTGVSPEQIELATASIRAGIPVAAGLRWPTSGHWQTEKVAAMEVMTPPIPAHVADGHSIAFVGFKKSSLFPGGGYFIFRNSWGPSFWDGGYGYMSFAYVAQYANDLMVFI